MRKLIAFMGAIVLLTVGLVGLTSVAAEAHTHDVDTSCTGLSVTLRDYAASKDAVQAVDQWWEWNGGQSQSHPFPDSRWGMDNGQHNGQPFQQPVNTAFKVGHGTNASWFYHQVVQGQDAKTNHVKVIVDGQVVTDQDFSTSFQQNYPWSDSADHTYTVTVTAWDDSHYSFTKSGTQKACVLADATASVSTTPATCSSGEKLVYGDIKNAVFSGTPDGTEGPGSYDVTATANQNHKFSNGDSTQEFKGDLAGPRTGDDCASIVSPVAPEVTQDECPGPGQSSGFSVTLADGPEGVEYSFDEESLVVTATADAQHKFGDLPEGEGWVKVDNHHATYQVTHDSIDCTVNVSPVNPDLTQPVCDGPGQHTGGTITPAETEGITYSVNGQTVTATPEDGYKIVLDEDSDWTLNQDGTATYNVVFDNPGDCLVEATPASVTMLGATCDTDGSLTIPDQPEGVLVTPEVGTYGPGTYEVVFSAAQGYTLTSNPSGSFTVEGATGDCPQPPPHHNPPPNNPPHHNNPPKHNTPATPTAIPAGMTGENSSTGTSTGAALGLVALGFFGTLLLIGGGTALVVAARRRGTER